jgi:hypothetical protein
MKPRTSLLLALALSVLVAPAAFGQFGPPAPGDRWTGPIHLPDLPGQNNTPITNRVSLQGRFVGTGVEGKIRLASGTQGTTLVQGLKATLLGLTPGAQYALLLDSRLVGTATANSAGSLKLVFLSPSNGRVPAVPEAAGVVTTATSASIVEVSSQRVVATATLSTGNTKPR